VLEILDHGATVNAEQYCTILWHLKETIHKKYPGLLIEKVVLFHSNAHPHTSCARVKLLE
jgi:hypothetical protein